MDEARELVDGNVDAAAPHEPPYVYRHNIGYEQAHTNEIDGPQSRSLNDVADADASNGIDETDSEGEYDIFDHDIVSANPSDYTKSFNRQRRFLDPTTPTAELPRTNPQQRPRANVAALIDDQIVSLARHAGKIKLDDQAAGLKHSSGGLGQERSDRATNEQVLDPKTRMILLQMINRGIVSEIHGCISTGKEANVYHAFVESPVSDDPVKYLAVKIYKTAILHFKDRSKYVSGEYRFQKGFSKRSNRGMVRLWAEKEFRNLKRMHGAGLPVPEPIYLRSHVLVMEFKGTVSKSGRITAAPLLRDIEFEEQADEQAIKQWATIYRQIINCMRVMYQTCRLVHADFSEYNTLYEPENEVLTIIDVSQSVEHDHPRSLDFLRMDIKNISSFFARKGVRILTEPSVFYFVTQEEAVAKSGSADNTLDHLAQDPVESSESDEVFRQQYIPQTLNQVPNFELKADSGQSGGKTVHGDLLAPNGQADAADFASQEESPSDSAQDGDEQETSSTEEGEGNAARPPRPRGKRFEDKTAKKEHKAAVKDEKRERRKTKMPKQMKKRLVNTKSRSQKR